MSASKVAAEVLRVLDKHGELSSALLLKESTPKNAVLHSSLEWDNGEAGHKYRLIQCGQLIRSVTVQITRHDGEPRTVRAYVHVPRVDDQEGDEDEGPSGYVHQEVVGGSPELSRLALREMERRWKQLRRSYQEYAEFWLMIQGENEAA